jgi:hypothetical protein
MPSLRSFHLLIPPDLTPSGFGVAQWEDTKMIVALHGCGCPVSEIPDEELEEELEDNPTLFRCIDCNVNIDGFKHPSGSGHWSCEVFEQLGLIDQWIMGWTGLKNVTVEVS